MGKQGRIVACRLHDTVMVILGDCLNELMDSSGSVLERPRPDILPRKASNHKRVPANVNSNVTIMTMNLIYNATSQTSRSANGGKIQ